MESHKVHVPNHQPVKRWLWMVIDGLYIVYFCRWFVPIGRENDDGSFPPCRRASVGTRANTLTGEESPKLSAPAAVAAVNGAWGTLVSYEVLPHR